MDKRHIKGPGRYDNSRKRQYKGKCDVRLTAEEDIMLDKLSKAKGVTRSDVMRRALRDFWVFNTEDGVKIE